MLTIVLINQEKMIEVDKSEFYYIWLAVNKGWSLQGASYQCKDGLLSLPVLLQ